MVGLGEVGVVGVVVGCWVGGAGVGVGAGLGVGVGDGTGVGLGGTGVGVGLGFGVGAGFGFGAGSWVGSIFLCFLAFFDGKVSVLAVIVVNTALPLDIC